MEYDWQKTQSRLVDTVRDHPVPFALFGLGLGWMLLSGIRGRPMAAEQHGSDYSAAEEGLGYGHAEPEAQPYGGPFEAAGYGRSAPQGGDAAQPGRGYVQGAAERTRQWSQRASEAASRVGHRAQDWAQSARERVGEAGQAVRAQAAEMADRSMHTFHDHPVMVGSVALLIGAAIGASLPRTRGESRLAHAGGYAAKARQVGERAAEAAREGGRQAFERIKDTAAQAAGEAVQHVREAVRDDAERPGSEGYRH